MIQIELHYFDMKITTTWTFSCDSSRESGQHSMWQHVSLLSIYYGSGTSRSANHNTVGIMITLPSLHAILVSRLSSPFLHPLFVLVVRFFFRMEILRLIGAACSGGMVPHSNGIGWGMGQCLKTDSRKLVGESLSFNHQWGNLKTAPMCSLFQLGFDHKWSTAKAGGHAATWLKCRVCTHKKRTYSVQYSPSVNHIHSLKTNAKQKTVLSQTLLPVSAHNITNIWFMVIQKVSEVYRNAALPFNSTHTYLIFSQRRAGTRFFFLFFPQTNLLHISGFQYLGLPVASWPQTTAACLAQGQTTYDFEENSVTLFSFGPGGKGVMQCSKGRWFSDGVSERLTNGATAIVCWWVKVDVEGAGTQNFSTAVHLSYFSNKLLCRFHSL